MAAAGRMVRRPWNREEGRGDGWGTVMAVRRGAWILDVLEHRGRDDSWVRQEQRGGAQEGARPSLLARAL